MENSVFLISRNSYAPMSFDRIIVIAKNETELLRMHIVRDTMTNYFYPDWVLVKEDLRVEFIGKTKRPTGLIMKEFKGE